MIHTHVLNRGETAQQARLIGYDRLLPTPSVESWWLDIPLANIWIHRQASPSIPTSVTLTKTGKQQILWIFSVEKCRRWNGIYRDLIAEPSAIHLIVGRNDHRVLELRRGVPQQVHLPPELTSRRLRRSGM